MKQLNAEQQQKLNGVLAQMAGHEPGHEAGHEPATPTPNTVAVDMTALMAEIARLKAENEALKIGHRPKVGFKVSEKGGISLYGLGAYPVTLYKEQWEALFEVIHELKEFIAKADADGKLATPEMKAARKAELKAQREAAKA